AAVNNDTTTTVICTDPVIVGNASQCTATVTDNANATTASTPSGEITFSTDNPEGTFPGPGAERCLLSGSGDSASCTLTYRPRARQNPPGTKDQIAAQFAEDANHNSSADTFELTVNAAAANHATTTTLS